MSIGFIRTKSQDNLDPFCYDNGMDILEGLFDALDYVEAHLTEKIEIEKVAQKAYCSRYHFQRVFGAIFGVTFGTYLRERRLSLAGLELQNGAKVIDVAFQFGYDSPESFSRAFFRYHNVLPSFAQAASLRYRSKPTIPKKGESKIDMLNCKIRSLSDLTLFGFTKRFHGVPYGKERDEQIAEFFSTTRAKQWLLIGASRVEARDKDYCVITNLDEDGYDFSIAYELDEWTRNALYDPAVTGLDFLDRLGFKTIFLHGGMYAVFETKQQDKFYPIPEYEALRCLITDFLPQKGFQFKDAPEVTVFHGRGEKRMIEIRMPVEINSLSIQ